MTVEPATESQESFDALAERHRREIQLHCYRMLGSLHDAEDAVQDTLLRAWRGRAGFDGRGSFRAWLYRIATNACLRSIERRQRVRRLMPDELGPAVPFEPLGAPDRETPWLEPLPAAWIDDVVDTAPGPEARYEAREATRIAFIAAIQRLGPRQRAALLLRDVLGLSAAETAAVLDTSTAAVNSLVQRARRTLSDGPAAPRGIEDPVDDGARQKLLERYVATWESGDVEGFVALLAEDATWTMPPWRQWYRGPEPIGAFVAWARGPERRRRARLVPTSANGQPAFAYYRTQPDGSLAVPFAIQVLEVRDGRVRAIVNFVDTDLFARFGLPPSVDLRSR